MRPFGMVMALAAGLLLASASAQGWSVQTVALRDLRQAHAVVGQLQALGFDAFSEFAMHDGQQFVRVRVGCYTDRAAAQAAATALSGHVTKQAVVVTLGVQSKASGCVSENVGFLKPATWKQLPSQDGLPSFSVEVGGHRAELVFGGDDWQVVQAGATVSARAATSNADFVEARPGGVPWAAQELASGTRMLCPGELVGHAGSAAVVERSGEVVACRLVPLSSELANGTRP